MLAQRRRRWANIDPTLGQRLVCWISGNALRWFVSYLIDRQQMVKVEECVGGPFQTKYGVPQGSVIGPLLFTLYTPFIKIISEQNLCHHLDAMMTHRSISYHPNQNLRCCLSRR